MNLSSIPPNKGFYLTPLQRRAKTYTRRPLPQPYNTPAMRAVRRMLARHEMISMIARLTGEPAQRIWTRALDATTTSPDGLDAILLAEYNRALIERPA